MVSIVRGAESHFYDTVYSFLKMKTDENAEMGNETRPLTRVSNNRHTIECQVLSKT